MATYRIEATNGSVYEIEADDDLTEEEVGRLLQDQDLDSYSPKSPFGARLAPLDPEPDRPESRGIMRGTGDFVTGVVGAVPRAAGGLVSIGSLIPGVNVIADPVAEALMDAGDWVDDTFLSEYQKNINEDMAQAMADSARQLGPDATIGDHIKNITSQGGAAAKFIAENPSQALMLAGQAIPYIVGGGIAAKGVQATAKGVQALRGTATTGLGARTAAASGEGLIAGGAVTEQIVSDLRDQGVTGYTADRLYGIPAGAATALIGRGGAALGGKTDIDTIVANKISGEATDLVQEGASQGLRKSALKGLVTESGEEFLQSGSEEAFTNLGTGQPISENVGGAAVLGASAGAPIGAVGGIIASRGDKNSETRVKDPLLEKELVEEEVQLQNEIDKEGVKGANLGQANAELSAANANTEAKLQKRALFEAAKSFTPQPVFEEERKQKRITEALDPNTEIGAAYEDYKITAGVYPQTDKADLQELTRKGGFLENFIPVNDKDLAKQQFEIKLAEYAQGLQDGTIQKRPDNVDEPVEKGKGKEPVVETTTKETVKQPKPENPKRIAARAYAVEKLGEDWEKQSSSLSQMFVDDKNIFRPLKGKNAGKTKWEKNVDDVLAAREAEAKAKVELETKKTTNKTGEKVVTPVEPLTKEAKDKVVNLRGLSEEQQKIYDVLVDHFVGDKKFDIDQVYVNGQFRPTKISKLAGVKGKQNVNTAINRFKTKFVEQQGTLKKNASKNEKDQAVAKFAKGLSDQAKQQRADEIEASREAPSDELVDAKTDVVGQRIDADEISNDANQENVSILGQTGMGIRKSVGEGTYKDVAPEDVEFTKARSEEKDTYENERQERADKRALEDDKRLIQDYGVDGVRLWRSIKSDDAVDITALNRKDLREWLSAVEENLIGDITDAQLQQDQKEIEKRYDTDTPQNNTETEIAGATTTPESGNQTKQVGTQDNRETQPPEGDPDSFTAGKDKTDVNVEKKKTSKLRKSVKRTTGQGATTVEALEDYVNEAIGATDNLFRDDIRNNPPIREAKTLSTTVDTGPEFVNFTFPIYANSPYGRVVVVKTAKEAHKDIYKDARVKRKKLPYTPKIAEKVIGYSLNDLENAQGFITPDGVKTYLIADNIEAGTEEAVIQHEVGVHLGLEEILTPEEVDLLSNAVNEWKNSPKNSVERQIHDNTMKRLVFARATGMDESQANIETIAYAVEEAVLAGVEPDANSESLAAKWLSDIKSFFEELSSRFLGKKPQLSASELVALSRGAASGSHYAPVREVGATTKGKIILKDYYAGADRYNIVEEDAEVEVSTKEKERSGLSGYKGEEPFKWGKNSKFGEFTDIRTEAYMYYDTDDLTGLPKLRAIMDVYSGPKNKNPDPILTLDADQLDSETTAISGANIAYLPNTFSLMINADRGGKETKGIQFSGDWKRLEGVRQRDLIRLLTEFRRRITRHRFGIVPNIEWVRMTGASATDSAQKILKGLGKEGFAGYETIRKRFSLKKYDEGLSIQNAKGRAWVKKNLGDDGAQLYDALAGLIQNPKEQLKFLYDFVADVEKVMPSARTAYNALKSHDAVRNRLIQEADKIAVRSMQLSPERRALVNDFLDKSTFFQQWGYDPEDYHPDVFKNKNVKVNDILKRAFNRFDDYEKQIIADIFAYGEKRRKETQDIAKEKGITGNFFSTSSLQGPYAPLKRFGDQVVVLKSKALLDAEKAFEENQNGFNRKKLEELKGNKKDYVVQFFDTKGAANKFAEINNVANGGKYARSESFPRNTQYDNENAPPTQLLESLLGKLKAGDNSGLDSQSKEAFRKMILEHYFESMDYRDARTSGAKRLNRAGYNKDMIRSFIFQARAGANLIATLKTSDTINEAMATAKKEAAEDRGKLEQTYQLLNNHYTQMMRREDGFFNAIQDRIAAFNTVSMLTTNFAYHVQNHTQILIAHNKLAGDFGKGVLPSYGKAWAEIFKAYRIAHKSIKGGFFNQVATVATIGMVNTNNNVEIDNTDESMPQEYQELVRELELHQLADVGIQEDLNQVNRFDTGFGLINEATDFASGMTHRLYQVARYVEAHNRLTTAIAAYEMAKKNPKVLRALNVNGPVAYAIQAVQHTQGAFNGLDAPLAFKRLPKLTTQYRKYQVMMAWNYGRAMKQAMAGETPEVKMIGWRTLGVTLSHAAIVSGLKGLPIITPVAGLLMLWGADDDTEFAEKAKANNGYTEYVEQVIREKVENKDIANLLTRGLPAYLGLDFSGKIGHQNIFAFQPYSDLEWTRDGVASYVFDVFAGPTASILRNFGGAGEELSKGDLSKAASLVLPKGARHYMDSYTYATDGYKASNKDVILDPRSISLTELLMTATGLPPTEIQNLKFTRGQQFKMLEYFSESSSRLRREYIQANRSRDTAKMNALRDEWRDLQRAKDRVRPFFNDSPNILTRSPVSDLVRSPRYQERRQQKLRIRLGVDN